MWSASGSLPVCVDARRAYAWTLLLRSLESRHILGKQISADDIKHGAVEKTIKVEVIVNRKNASKRPAFGDCNQGCVGQVHRHVLIRFHQDVHPTCLDFSESLHHPSAAPAEAPRGLSV